MTRKPFRSIFTLILACCLLVAALPLSASADQTTQYHDPAKIWLDAASRTNEFNINAIVTTGTMYCRYCTEQQNGSAGAEPHVMTSATTFRVPEYTRDGVSNMARNIAYSDGVMNDDKTAGNVLVTSPLNGGIYTGYHWTKTVCNKCGRLNTNTYTTSHAYLKDIYYLYDCDARFFGELPETVRYEYADDTYHKKTVSGGEYCGFCFGTHHHDNTTLERHDLERAITPQLGHQRFMIVDQCKSCDYEKVSYITAKSVVASYYGVVDGQPHTLTVTDLSEGGVTASIRYGNSAESCTLSSAPNYTAEGQNTVYYEITYNYGGTTMTENGVAYVWLRDESAAATPTCSADTSTGAHSYAYLDTVAPTCLTLGYDRYLCSSCGAVEKRNYTAALSHTWQGVVAREATCEQDGKLMEICRNCGEVKVTSTPKSEHSYKTYSIAATCTSPGYTVKECDTCGDRQITNITPALAHNYEEHIIPATCEAGGKTVHLCHGCGSSFVTDYTDPTGHVWDEGRKITSPTCGGEGIMEYWCVQCGYHRLEAVSSIGHTPGAPATCTEPQTCVDCGAVLQNAHSHHFQSLVTPPACEKMGYTTFTCSDCGLTYKSDYTEATGHKAGDWIVDAEPTTEAEGKRHKECVNCGEIMETEVLEKLPAIVPHTAYIVGYPDGNFGPEDNMTRAEAAAIFARLLADKNGDNIKRNSATKFTDVAPGAWYAGYVKYLSGYQVIYGVGGDKFAPEKPITRAEFTAMAVRFYREYAGTLQTGLKAGAFDDVASRGWAYEAIQTAAAYGWVVGYGDDTFRPIKNISRAEAVSIVNRVVNRTADREYITNHFRTLHDFPDVPKSHWAYWNIMEAANTHTASILDSAENWKK